MTAHFYLMAESFSNNTNFTQDEIEEKVKRLSEDVRLINRYKETNKLYTNYSDIYPQVFYSNYTVYDFICNAQHLKEVGIDRDIINALQNIIQRSDATTITSNEVKEELFGWIDSENCHGLIAFNRIVDFDESIQVIYGRDGWYKFRRNFLSIYPKSTEFYINECIKYFPNLTFHTRNIETIKEIYPDFVKSVVRHLGYLNDIFFTYRVKDFSNESEKYKAFSVECQLEEYAASKDKNFAKEKLTFDFLDATNQLVAVTCYPHLRLSKSDCPGDSKYYHNRIYFHEGISSIASGNILIGHIGGHRD